MLNVANLLAGAVKDFNLPVLPMNLLKVSAGKAGAGMLLGVEVDVVSHVVVLMDGLKYFHKIELLEMAVKAFLRNTSRAYLLILARLIGDDAVFLDCKQKTQFEAYLRSMRLVSQELKVGCRGILRVSRNDSGTKAPQAHFLDISWK